MTESTCQCATCSDSCRCAGVTPAEGGCCCGETCTCGPDCECPPSCGCPNAKEG